MSKTNVRILCVNGFYVVMEGAVQVAMTPSRSEAESIADIYRATSTALDAIDEREPTDAD